MFAPTNYAEGLDNKAAVGMSKDVEGGCKVKLFILPTFCQFPKFDQNIQNLHSVKTQDDLEKVISGYQPVPQQPPPSFPKGANSLPRCQVRCRDLQVEFNILSSAAFLKMKF